MTESITGATKHTEPDPLLRRVWVYNVQQFKTHDGVYYKRELGSTDGPIRRQIPKVRGKSARRADKKARRCQQS